MNRKRYLRLALSAAIVGGAFVYGLLVGDFRIFPYNTLQQAKRLVAGVPAPSTEGELIETTLLTFEKTFVNYANDLGLVGYGGGLARVGDRILGVDSDGHFFLYQEAGIVTALDITLDTNEALLSAYLDEHLPGKREMMLRSFRVLDIAVREERPHQIIVTHNYWNPESATKTTRLSRATIEELSDLLSGRPEAVVGPWETVYETIPPIPFDHEPAYGDSAMVSVQSGGRMVFDSDGHIVVGFGDHQFDGVAYPNVTSQNTESSYGKLIKIDLQTLEARPIALGLRNPSGLLRDQDGNLWTTDSGPQGGDELNLVQPGTNFGWPFVTYGTEYDRNEWPLAAVQGRHEGYTRPWFVWMPSIGTSNLIQLGAIPQRWSGDLLVASLGAKRLYRLRVRDDRVIFNEPVDIGGRIRDLEQLGDGTIVLWLDAAMFIELAQTDTP